MSVAAREMNLTLKWRDQRKDSSFVIISGFGQRVYEDWKQRFERERQREREIV